jgi:Sec-independent protein translocase protein TatA
VKKLKPVYQTIIDQAKRLPMFARTIANAFKQGRRQEADNQQEIERLDRLRNPSKYRGV